MNTIAVLIGFSVLCVMYAVYYWEWKQIADNSELEHLEELAREHE